MNFKHIWYIINIWKFHLFTILCITLIRLTQNTIVYLIWKRKTNKKHTYLDLYKITLKFLENFKWKILKEIGKSDHLTCLLRNLYAGQEATDKKNWTWNNRLVPNRGKEYVKAVYCHPAYLTYMQSTSWEALGWKKHKLESRLGEK